MPKVVNVAKSKKVTRSSASSGNAASEKTTEAKPLTDREIFFAEEEAVSLSGGSAQMEAFNEAKCNLVRHLNEIFELKSQNVPQGDKRFLKLKIACLNSVMQLKRLNREAQFRLKKIRQQTNNCKAQIDNQHLQLQNLLYECMHLQREIIRCQEFRSKHESIDLVPIDEFYDTAPEEIAQPEETREDEHKQMMARLNWELRQRVDMAERLADGNREIDTVQADIKQKRDQLDSLRPLLANLGEAAKPLEDILGQAASLSQETCDLALLLPTPLYVLYNQINAYASASMKPLEVAIDGDREEALAAREAALHPVRQADKEIEDDDDEEEETSGSKKRKKRQQQQRRREPESDQQQQQQQQQLTPHPLSVRAILGVKGWPDNRLRLIFHFLPAVNLLTVRVQLQPAVANDNQLVVQADQLLCGLYSGDSGRSAPHAAARRSLASSGVESLWDQRHKIGIAYAWVQRLGGVNCLPDQTSYPSVDTELAFFTVPECIKRLRQRTSARLHLLRCLDSLASRAWSAASAAPELTPTRIQLTAWQRVTYDSYCELSYTRHWLTSEDDLFFVANIAQCQCPVRLAVCVPADYPLRHPLISLSVGQLTSQSDLDLHAIETEVNVYPDYLLTGSRHEMLLAQLHRLLLCIEVYFSIGDRRCARQRKFASRQKPTRYLPSLDVFVHRG